MISDTSKSDDLSWAETRELSWPDAGPLSGRRDEVVLERDDGAGLCLTELGESKSSTRSPRLGESSFGERVCALEGDARWSAPVTRSSVL
mmetsp:Transcript_48809/g.115932  ORF Transcript_48809/g.115932 Transcript_48809/m.115932 type:complete len:90 (+) Transcript_48809:490-759(+)